MEGQIQEGNGALQCNVYEECGIDCAKIAEPIKLPFGTMSRMGGPENHGVQICRAEVEFWVFFLLFVLHFSAFVMQ